MPTSTTAPDTPANDAIATCWTCGVMFRVGREPIDGDRLASLPSIVRCPHCYASQPYLIRARLRRAVFRTVSRVLARYGWALVRRAELDALDAELRRLRRGTGLPQLDNFGRDAPATGQ